MANDAQHKRDHEYKLAVLATLQLFIGKAQPVIIVGLICAAVVLSSRYLAGKITFADIAFRVLADFKGLRALAMLSMGGFGAAGVTYGYMQRRLRVASEAKAKRDAIASSQPSKSVGKGN